MPGRPRGRFPFILHPLSLGLHTLGPGSCSSFILHPWLNAYSETNCHTSTEPEIVCQAYGVTYHSQAAHVLSACHGAVPISPPFTPPSSHPFAPPLTNQTPRPLQYLARRVRPPHRLGDACDAKHLPTRVPHHFARQAKQMKLATAVEKCSGWVNSPTRRP